MVTGPRPEGDGPPVGFVHQRDSSEHRERALLSGLEVFEIICKVVCGLKADGKRAAMLVSVPPSQFHGIGGVQFQPAVRLAVCCWAKAGAPSNRNRTYKYLGIKD